MNKVRLTVTCNACAMHLVFEVFESDKFSESVERWHYSHDCRDGGTSQDCAVEIETVSPHEDNDE